MKKFTNDNKIKYQKMIWSERHL